MKKKNLGKEMFIKSFIIKIWLYIDINRKSALSQDIKICLKGIVMYVKDNKLVISLKLSLS